MMISSERLNKISQMRQGLVKNSRSGSSQNHADGAQNDLDIQPYAPVLDIGHIL
jgi:hypothetical protein